MAKWDFYDSNKAMDWAYENITVRNYTAENVWRTANADSGIATSGRQLQRASASLTSDGTADGLCGAML